MGKMGQIAIDDTDHADDLTRIEPPEYVLPGAIAVALHTRRAQLLPTVATALPAWSDEERVGICHLLRESMITEELLRAEVRTLREEIEAHEWRARKVREALEAEMPEDERAPF